jgi:hypothetical protein
MSKEIDPVEVSGNQLELALDIRPRLSNVAYGRHCGKSQQGRPSHTVRLQSASGCQERCAPLPLPALPTRSLWLFLATEWSAKTVRWLAIAGG